MEEFDSSLESPSVLQSNSCHSRIDDPYTNFYPSPLWIVFWAAVFFFVQIFGKNYYVEHFKLRLLVFSLFYVKLKGPKF